MCVNGVGRLSGREDMSKTKMALNPRLRLEVFHVTVKRPSKVGQRKVRSLVRNRKYIQNISKDTICRFYLEESATLTKTVGILLS